MALPAFNTHKFVVKLKKLGFDDPKAEGLVETFVDLQEIWQPVSREYLDKQLQVSREYLDKQLQASREYLDNRLKTDREYLDERLDRDIQYLDRDIKSLKEQFNVVDKRFDEVTALSNERFNAVDKKFDAVDKKFDKANALFNERFNKEREYLDTRFREECAYFKAEISTNTTHLIKWTVGLLIAQTGLIIALIKLTTVAAT